jgi:hypothetical protein
LSACCRNAPTVRFINFDIFATGVLAFEWAFSARWSPLVHERRFTDLFTRFAI